MDVAIYNCKHESQDYTIRYAVVKSTECQIFDIFRTGESEITQYFVSHRLKRLILSVSTVQDNEKLLTYANIIRAFLSGTAECVQIDAYTAQFIYFSVPHARFQVNINHAQFHYNVKIGSNDFMNCVDVNIDKSKDYTKPQRLMQIYSEPECWRDLVKGSTVDMIKGSLQFIQAVFDVHSFVFEDNSNIECGITNMSQKPPRKLSTPFSLGHLFLVTKNKTWYEYNFGAIINDESDYERFKSRLSILDRPKQLTTYAFFKIAQMTREQQSYIEPFYERAETWRDFFTSVPKNKQCFAFFNWLPFFLDEYLFLSETERSSTNKKKFGLRNLEWRIDMNNEHFKRTGMIIELNPELYKIDAIAENQKGGGGKCRRRRSNTSRKGSNIIKRRRSTLKNNWSILSFSSERAGQTI